MVTPRTFAQALLAALDLPVTYNNVAALVAWQAAEGGHFVNPHFRYNPLNTTRKLPGSFSPGGPAGVQSYQSWDQGLEATQKTLAQKDYTTIRVRLGMDADPSDTLAAVKATPWGTTAINPDAWKAAQAYGARSDPEDFGSYSVASLVSSVAPSGSGVVSTLKAHPWLTLTGAGLILGTAGALAYHFRKPGARPRFLSNPARRSSSGHVQTLLLPRTKFTPSSAAAWARNHGFRSSDVDVTDRYVRLRQASPDRFSRLRTIPFGSGGVKAVVGWR